MAKLELVRLRREVITQAQLEEIVEERERLKGWRARPEEMGRRMQRDMVWQFSAELAIDEWVVGEALERGAEVERGRLTEAVLRTPAASSRRLWRKWGWGEATLWRAERRGDQR
jgi:hypothetical protein